MVRQPLTVDYQTEGKNAGGFVGYHTFTTQVVGSQSIYIVNELNELK